MWTVAVLAGNDGASVVPDGLEDEACCCCGVGLGCVDDDVGEVLQEVDALFGGVGEGLGVVGGLLPPIVPCLKVGMGCGEVNVFGGEVGLELEGRQLLLVADAVQDRGEGVFPEGEGAADVVQDPLSVGGPVQGAANVLEKAAVRRGC